MLKSSNFVAKVYIFETCVKPITASKNDATLYNQHDVTSNF